MKKNCRFRTIGDIDRLPEVVRDAVRALEEKTKNNTSTCMVLALSYSSKWEITEAVKAIASKVEKGEMKAEEITETVIDSHLNTFFMPEPELMIRTGGEERLSNFLLWQSAYTEFYFTDTYWPDFTEEDLCKAIYDYQNRQRRFGKTGEQVVAKPE
jgi:undecaprenyl diphosphate synthase